MAEYLMGVDLGTGGCKITLIDTRGRFVCDGYAEYPSHHPHVGWVEQSPKDWFPAVSKALHRAAEAGGVDPRDIIGLSVDASAHNMVLLGRGGEVLRDTIMWQDQRARQEVAFLRDLSLIHI